MYELVDPEGTGPALLDRRVAPGTSLLVTGPVMSRKERLVATVLAPGHAAGEGITMVSTDDPADAVQNRFAEFVEIDEPRFGVVDCTGRSGGGGLSASGRTQYVSSPDDLTGVGIGITRALESLAVPADDYRLGFDSLSTLLAYRAPEDVFKFCHVLTARLERLGCLSVMTLDAGAHDDRTMNLVARAFDGSIDIREPPAGATHDQPYELRLRGFDATPEWTPIDLP